MTRWASDLARGAAGGTAGTATMTVVFFAAQKLGWMGRLPPARITAAGLDAAGVRRSRRSEDAWAAAAHLGFGVACGALLGLLAPLARRALPLPVAGALFGVAVWGASYAGWVPALGILPPPHRDRRGRQPALVLAHLVYGATAGALLRR